MATNWTIQNKISDVGPNWDIGPHWEAISETWEDLAYHWHSQSNWGGQLIWEDLTDHYWGWSKTWTFSGKASTRDSD